MRRYLVFAVAAIVLLPWAINATAVAVAIPPIVSTFNTSLILAGWVLSGYQLAVTASMPLSGKISDAFGRRLTLIVFLSLFTAGSLLCSIAPNIESLIFFRIIQGLGGSGFMPAASGAVAEYFPRSRQRALGLFTSILPIGWIIGPNLGGWLTTVLGWRSIFWINIPLCAIALVAWPLLLPKGERKESHIDLAGAGLLAGALAVFMIGLSTMGSSDGTPPWALVGLLLGASFAGMIFFWRRQKRVKDPILEPEVLRQKPFLAANIFNFIYGGSIGAASLVPIYVVSIYGMSTLESGFILTPRSVGVMVASGVISLCLVRWGYRWPMLLGTIFTIPCCILLGLEPVNLTVLGLRVSTLSFILVVMGVQGLAMGTTAPAANNACIELMPHRIGTITGLRVMFRQAGSAVCITVGSLLLHNAGIARGFQFFFFGLSALMVLVMIPSIFAMPRSPVDVPKGGKL